MCQAYVKPWQGVPRGRLNCVAIGHTQTHACTHAYTHASAHACTHAYTHAYTHAFACAAGHRAQ